MAAGFLWKFYGGILLLAFSVSKFSHLFKPVHTNTALLT